MKISWKINSLLLLALLGGSLKGQVTDSVWTLPKCIDYAMQKNISIQQKALTNETNRINADQAKAMRIPSLSAAVSQNFQWNRDFNNVNSTYGSYSGSDGTNYSINSSVRLFNGFKTTNDIKQAELSYQAGNYDVETFKEAISLNVLDAYLQVLYSEEQVKNSEKQVESTTQQLSLSEERLKLGSISRADYLQVNSQLATEKLTLANAQNQLAVNRVSLMQLMELPVSGLFAIEHPSMEISQAFKAEYNADSVYTQALEIKPQIKGAELNKQIADVNVSVAKSGYLPTLTLNGTLSTGYLSGMGMNYDYQVKNKLNPSVGLTLSIPIFQNRQVHSSVAIAKIGTTKASLNEFDVKNQLRKSIEQACVNLKSAYVKYQASLEKFNSVQESYNVAQEKFSLGSLSSVDFLIQKTNLITAESDLLQSKYNLVFSKKILDFYLGSPLTL